MSSSRLVIRITGEKVKIFGYRGVGRGRHALNGTLETDRKGLRDALKSPANQNKLGLKKANRPRTTPA